MVRRVEKIANERIQILFNLAEKSFPSNPERAQRYADLARKIAMRTRVKLPRRFRRMICRRCNSILWPGVSSRTRIRQRREPHVATTCFKCGFVTRIPLRRRKI